MFLTIKTSRLVAIVIFSPFYYKMPILFLGFIVQRGEKLVRECSLNGAEYILIDERIYCANKNEFMNQTRAVDYCRQLNATLPLPLSLLEFEVFSNFSSPEKAWIGISDSSNSGIKENWRDIENNKPAYVKTSV